MEEKQANSGGGATTSTPKSLQTAVGTEPALRRRGGALKRKSNGATASTPSKRQAREKLSATPPPAHNGPCTRARQSPNNHAAAAAASSPAPPLVPADFGVFATGLVPANRAEQVVPLESASAVVVIDSEEVNVANEEWEALERKIEAEFEAIRSRDTNAHVVPVHSGWFSWTKVHSLEERTMVSFFNGKSKNRTSEIYMDIRNWIMKKYHADPNTNIDTKDLSEMSVGDMDARRAVMEFLDYWGLINFHPFPENESTEATATAIDASAKKDSMVEKLYHFETLQSYPLVAPKTNIPAPAIPTRLIPVTSLAEELVKSKGPSVEYHCNSCSADCSRKRYHCQKQADFDLCTECFNNRKFGSGMSSSDFILMEPAEVPGVSGGKWTDQETLLLLEALELYKENWSEIAEHVATKTKVQCILHFVQMSIDDAFLDCDDETDATLQENTNKIAAKISEAATSTENDSRVSKDTLETIKDDTFQPMLSPAEASKAEDGENCILKALKEAFEAVGATPMDGGPLSFAEVGNPVMALAAFLVRLVESDVTTASVRSSFKYMSGKSPGIQLAARHCFILEDPPDDKKENGCSESAVAEMIDHDAQKDETENNEDKKEQNPIPVLDASDPLIDKEENKVKEEEKGPSVSPDEENGPSVSPDEEPDEEKGPSVSPDEERVEDSKNATEADAANSHEAGTIVLNESKDTDVPKDTSSVTVEEHDNISSKVELPGTPTVKEESGEGAIVEERAAAEGPSQCTEPEAPKDVDMISESLPPDTNEPQDPVKPSSFSENGENTGEDQTKESKSERNNLTETKVDNGIDKIKHAAITAISAAAVKAKLLADQEEDQIRQLTTLLIEKQLYKLESKLNFFTEMESVMLRVREQLDRSRQRLYQERAHIIATRLGLPASSSRAMPPSLSANRMGMRDPSSATKPPMSMLSQRPPVSRPTITSPPPGFVSSPMVTENSVRPSGPQ